MPILGSDRLPRGKRRHQGIDGRMGKGGKRPPPAGEATGCDVYVSDNNTWEATASRGGSDGKVINSLVHGIIGKRPPPAGEATLHAAAFYFQSEGKRPPPAGEATVRSSCPLMTARSSMGSANRDFPVFLSAVSMLFFFWALGVRAYRIMVSLGSYPFFVPI